MVDSSESLQKILEGLHKLMRDNNTYIQFDDFMDVSKSMMDGYARLVRSGMPGQTIALAMLGATLNMYEMFGLTGELPGLLRTVADKIESDVRPN